MAGSGAHTHSRFPSPAPGLGSATAPESHLEYLTSIRNAVIGSKTKKAALAQHGDISYFVTLLTSPLPHAHALEIRSQAATILGSIAHGASIPTLLVLLQAHTPQQLISSLHELITTTSPLTPSISSPHLPTESRPVPLLLTSPSPTPLKTLESLIRALRALMLAVADELSASPRWGLGSGWGTKGGAPSTSAVPAGARLRSFSRSSASASYAHADLQEGEAQQREREVRILGRRAVAHCFYMPHLHLVLAPLMLVPSSQPTTNSSILSADPSGPSGPAGAGAVPPNLFPSSTKVRLNNITEMIFSLLSACLAIPGPGPEPLHTSTTTRDSYPTSPEAELLERRTNMLAFRAQLAPWILPSQEEEEEEEEEEEGEEEDGDSRIPPRLRNGTTTAAGGTQIQAELLHSPSRSGSLDRQHPQRRRATGKGKGVISYAHRTADEGADHMETDDDGSLCPGAAAVLTTRPAGVGLMDVLVEAVEGSLAKTREAALWTMAELVRDCPLAAKQLILCQTASGEQPTTMILRFREDPDVDIRLAAFCCMSNIVKVHNFGSNTSEYVLAALIELLDPSAPPMSLTGVVSSSSSSSSSSTAGMPPPGTGSGARAHFDNIRTQLLGGGSSSSSRAPTQSQQQQQQQQPTPTRPITAALTTPRQLDIQVQASFALARLLSDEVELQLVAQERFGIVRRMAGLVEGSWRELRRRIGGGGGGVGGDGIGNGNGSGVGMGVDGVGSGMLVAGSGGRLVQSSAPVAALSESVVRLLEASLTVLATVAFHIDEIRQAIIESSSPALLPILAPALTIPHAPGIRIAACRLVRALSRSVATLRTSLVDAGVGEKLLVLLHEKPGVGVGVGVGWVPHEVRLEVVASLCNMVLRHSPMHELLVQGGGVQRLVSFLDGDGDGDQEAGTDGGGSSSGVPTAAAAVAVDGAMVVNVLWALKNIVCRATLDVKRTVGQTIGWDRLLNLAVDGDPMIQEQALNVLRNLAAVEEADIEMTCQAIGLERLLDLLERVIWERSAGRSHGGGVGGGEEEEEEGSVLVLVQAAHVLVNLATGNRTVRMAVLQRANLLDAILFFMNHPREEIRVAGIWCASNLTYRLQPAYGHTERSEPTDDDVGIEAVKRLRAFDFEARIRDLLEREEALNVRDRAKVLLSAFEVVS
ncbi:unnamed protein product [Tilletia controversa]|nr:hypothetical protein CF336_g2130 [Tilletia laevis]CAD6896426.1 unnamed protein product [Tilletia caries]CAD6900928.1 unnamed protein product [Tilletia controversa]